MRERMDTQRLGEGNARNTGVSGRYTSRNGGKGGREGTCTRHGVWKMGDEDGVLRRGGARGSEDALVIWRRDDKQENALKTRGKQGEGAGRGTGTGRERKGEMERGAERARRGRGGDRREGGKEF